LARLNKEAAAAIFAIFLPHQDREYFPIPFYEQPHYLVLLFGLLEKTFVSLSKCKNLFIIGFDFHIKKESLSTLAISSSRTVLSFPSNWAIDSPGFTQAAI